MLAGPQETCYVPGTSASWRSGYAPDCKSVNAGSIPALASKPLFMGDIMAGLFFYRFIFLPLWFVTLMVRQTLYILRGRHKPQDLVGRLGKGPTTDRAVIWVHGASLGELGAARVLVEQLLEQLPDYDVVVTAGAPHARDMLQRWEIERCIPAIAPLDLRWSTRRFLRGFDCRMHITIENEMWPNRFILLSQRGIPIVAASARISARSVRQWKWLGRFPVMLLNLVSKVAPQSDDTRQNLLSLGLPPDRLLANMNLKALLPPRQPAPEELAPFAGAFRRDHTILGASTHAGEELPLLDAFAPLAKADTALRLIFAPRAVLRGDEIVALARSKGLSVAQRSKGEPPEAQVYVADTLYEMALWYSLAGITFVGGSLGDFGGHTPFEPAAYGSAILHGPFTSNFGTVYQDLDASGGARLVTPETIAQVLATLLGDVSAREAMTRVAKQLDQSRNDVLPDFVKAIVPLLAGRSSG